MSGASWGPLGSSAPGSGVGGNLRATGQPPGLGLHGQGLTAGVVTPWLGPQGGRWAPGLAVRPRGGRARPRRQLTTLPAERPAWDQPPWQ